VDLSTIFPKPIAYMRTRSQSCASHITNHLPLAYALPTLYCTLAHMQVLGSIHIVMLDLDVVAVAPAVRRRYNHTVSRSDNRCTVRGREIGSEVGFPSALHRMEPAHGVA